MSKFKVNDLVRVIKENISAVIVRILPNLHNIQCYIVRTEYRAIHEYLEIREEELELIKKYEQI